MYPMEELRNGGASARKSLLLSYTSLPPQMVIVQALKSRHFLLAALSLIAVLANVLTVTLSGLFTQRAVFNAADWPLMSMYQPSFQFVAHGKVSKAYSNWLQSWNPNDPLYVPLANLTNQTTMPEWTNDQYFFLPLGFETTLPDNGGLKLDFQSTGYGVDLECNELSTTSSDSNYTFTISNDAKFANFSTSYKQPDGRTIQCMLGTNQVGVGLKLLGDPAGPKAMEITTAMQAAQQPGNFSRETAFCMNVLLKAWFRSNMSFPNADPSTEAGNASEAGLLSPENWATVSQTVMSCQPRYKAAAFNLTTSPTGKILSSKQVTPTTYDLPNGTDFSYAWSSLVTTLGGQPSIAWHNDTFATDWVDYLIVQLTGSRAYLNANLPPPTFSDAVAKSSEVVQRVFTSQMSLMTELLTPSTTANSTVPARVLTLERRVFMSEPFFWISIAILSLDLVVAIAFYASAPAPFLPRLPNSIASQIAYFAGSHVIDDVCKSGGDLAELDRKGFRYSYGRYIGRDGWMHTGIERAPFVTELERPETWANALRRRWTRNRKELK